MTRRITTQAARRGGLALRTAHRCPNCGGACALREPKAAVNGVRLLWLLCLDERCVWSGVATVTVLRTVQASRLKRPVNSVPHEHGSLAMRTGHVCPICAAPAVTVNSAAVSELSRESLLMCSKPLCGWRGVVATEITGSVTLPHPAFRRAAQLPPLVAECVLSPAENTQWFD